jgi:SanA protein
MAPFSPVGPARSDQAAAVLDEAVTAVCMPHRRLVVRIVLGALATVVLLVAAANAIVLLGGRGTTHDPEAVPHAQVALVLGAGVDAAGRPSAMLEDRLRVAARLYREHRVDKVLASGDHGRPDYDEVNAMRRELLRLGVASSDLFTDHAGFDTLDSVVRARRVFEVRSAIIVTQAFHLPRALWLARHAGLEAHGLAADRGSYGSKGRLAKVREVLARTKAVKDVVTGAQPRFLGPRIDIAGDGRASRG